MIQEDLCIELTKIAKKDLITYKHNTLLISILEIIGAYVPNIHKFKITVEPSTHTKFHIDILVYVTHVVRKITIEDIAFVFKNDFVPNPKLALTAHYCYVYTASGENKLYVQQTAYNKLPN